MEKQTAIPLAVPGSQIYTERKPWPVRARDSRVIAEHLDGSQYPRRVVFKPVSKSSDEIQAVCEAARLDPHCAGVITWMHTFSPSKI